MVIERHSPFPVAIIGGGLGGLLLARMLFLRGMDFVVYDRDESATARLQGGTLDLHLETGQAALRRAGLFETFRNIARYEDQGIRVLDKHGAVLFEQTTSDAGGDRPEIDRGELRALLLKSLPAETIKWNRSFLSAEDEGDDLALKFSDGATEHAAFLVGSDGAWSRVRALLSDAIPRYVGIMNFELAIEDVDFRHPDLAALVGHGMLIAKGEEKTLFAHRNARGHIRVYVSLRGVAREHTETRESLISGLEGWDDRLVDIVRASGPEVRTWPLDVLPVNHHWVSRANMTLLGDAAHLMPPAGEGANLALLDAADLADVLTCRGNRIQALQLHESTMMARSAESAKMAMRMLGIGEA